MKIANYYLISKDDPTALRIAVNEMINANWQPFGSPSVTISYPSDSLNFTIAFIQAMVKYADN